MKRLPAIVVLFASLATLAHAQQTDRELINQAAAARAPQPAPPQKGEALPPRPEADSLAQQEQQARTELTLAQARLELVQARRSIKDEKRADAARRAQRVLALLKELPADVDASDLEFQAKGILADAAKAGIDVAGELDRRVAAAGKVARQYSGDPREVVDTTGDAQRLRQRTLTRQSPDDYGYRPGKSIIDADSLRALDQQRLHYEDVLHDLYKSDELRHLVEADEARVTPEGDIAYPPDWPQKVARRAKYEGGQIARSQSWTDKDGREWYVALYDIAELIYVPPDFAPPSSLFIDEAAREAIDREALRVRSRIFGGYAEDLAAGIPLLRFFGGIDDYALRGPKYSAERQRQIVEMIRAFTEQVSEAKIISLEP